MSPEMTQWLWSMFGVMCAGTFCGLIWPLAIAWWRSQQAELYKWISPPTKYGGVAPSSFGKFWVDYLLPFVKFAIVSTFITAVVAALAFGPFLSDGETRKKLYELGWLAYFSAFSAGFAAGSAAEEPMKNKSN
jgi:hypothetical protein